MAHTDYGTDTRIGQGGPGVGEWGSRGDGTFFYTELYHVRIISYK
ncbi:MAG: hypothetical protein SWX82_29235 [Cyanobacteriota bacterium]|nr:hypothetical protein [Cyanobacteriota bacterium]